jgi:CRP/FNR family transcriptional regulator, cyclic AMP receptor protein
MKKVLFLLGQLTDDDVEWLLANGRKERVESGQVLIREGQQTDALYVLLQGALEVSFASRGQRSLGRSTPTGPAPVQLGSGEVVGEMSFIDARPPSATVIAVEPAVVLAVPRSVLATHLEEDAAFAARFYRALAVFLSHRLRNMVGQLGYGAGKPLNEEVEYEDELDPDVLKGVHLAGSRFDRVLRRLLAQ